MTLPRAILIYLVARKIYYRAIGGLVVNKLGIASVLTIVFLTVILSASFARLSKNPTLFTDHAVESPSAGTGYSPASTTSASTSVASTSSASTSIASTTATSTSTTMPPTAVYTFFKEQGLPIGAFFNITFAHIFVSSTAGGEEPSFSTPPGSYYYYIANSTFWNGTTYNFYTSCSANCSQYLAAGATYTINFTYVGAVSTTTSTSTSTTSIPAALYTTFSEDTLPAGSFFSMTYANESKSVHITSNYAPTNLTFYTQPGNYFFVAHQSSITVYGAPILYNATPANGSVLAGYNYTIVYT